MYLLKSQIIQKHYYIYSKNKILIITHYTITLHTNKRLFPFYVLKIGIHFCLMWNKMQMLITY